MSKDHKDKHASHSSAAKTGSAEKHPGMMGDGTEEQNLGQKGDPKKRISEAEVEKAFGKKKD